MTFPIISSKLKIIYINDETKVSSAQGVPRRATVRSQKYQYKRDVSKYSAKTLVNTQTKQ
jgi:hypothetical protein